MIDKHKFCMNRDQLLNKLKESNIQSRPIWGLIHEQKPYRYNQTYKIEKANYYIERVLNIPCSTNLKTEDVKHICNILKELKK